jgi:hypothetical protein
MAQPTRIMFGGRLYSVDGYKGTAMEILEGDRIPVTDEVLLNRLVCEFWEPSGRYSGT